MTRARIAVIALLAFAVVLETCGGAGFNAREVNIFSMTMMSAAAELGNGREAPTPSRSSRSIGGRVWRGALAGGVVGLAFGLTRWFANRNKTGK